MTHISPWHISNDRWKLLIAVLYLAVQCNTQAPAQATTKLVITFTDIRSDKGYIAMGLYDSEWQWTDHPARNYKWTKEKLRNGSLTVEIENLPRKRVSLAVLDDENLNLDLDFFLGLPKEGWGMSTNPSFFKLKKPGFEEVSIDLDQAVIYISIKVNYLNKNKKIE